MFLSDAANDPQHARKLARHVEYAVNSLNELDHTATDRTALKQSFRVLFASAECLINVGHLPPAETCIRTRYPTAGGVVVSSPSSQPPIIRP